ncbi:MAG: response regulator [Pirellulaceae bacterium]|nr:response regulator [Pirellulaceae bacterium]
MPDGLGQIRVLLVEDDEDDYLLTKDLFTELPPGTYQLDRVADYASALRTLDECEHDVYLVDYRLGERTGLELIREAIGRGCFAPMIMLTGQREREVDLLAMQVGAVDYLVKDRLDVAALDRAIRYALRNKRLEEEIRQANQQLEQRVEQRTAELERVNAALQAEIAERLRAERALRDADRRKDEFLATLAHELRNPLSPLVAAAQLLAAEPQRLEQVQELAQVMTRQIEQLRQLIGDLLDVSRISSGKLVLRRDRLWLDEAIEAAVDVARPLMERAGHHFLVRRPPGPLRVEGDKVRLAQIVGNLLVNAAKYTPTGGRIELESEAEGSHAVIRIRDNGEGIPPEMLEQIFGLFNQVDSSNTRSHGGLGIGLTLVKTLVEMHGGTVAAYSAGRGEGSEFTVRLPLICEDVRADQPRQPSVGSSPPAAAATLRILVVDDNQSASHLLSRLLGKLGQDVLVANSAAEALEHIPKYAPQVVISDVAMPQMSGHELARSIRRLPLARQPTLIALTGYGQESDRREAMLAGFDRHLTKPIGFPELQELLQSLSAASVNQPST